MRYLPKIINHYDIIEIEVVNLYLSIMRIF